MEASRTLYLTFVRLLLISCLLISQYSVSATQGKPGLSSSGSFAIRLIVHPNLQAKMLNAADTAMKMTTQQARFNKKESLCIKGSGINRYTIAARGSAANGDFQLMASETAIPYDVHLWKGSQIAHRFSSNGKGKTLSVNSSTFSCTKNSHAFSVNLPATDKIRNIIKGTLGFTIMAE